MLKTMKKPRFVTVAVALLWLAGPAFAQTPAAPPLPLSQAVERALAQGDDVALQKATLDAAQSANGLANAKNGFTVSATVGYTGSRSFNDSTYTPAASATTYTAPATTAGASSAPSAGSATPDGVLLHTPTATLTLGTPLTSVTGGWTSGYEAWPDGTSRLTGTATAKVTQTLWNGYWGGTTQAAVDKAALTFQIAQLNAQASRNKIVLTVKQAFFTLLSAQDNLNLLTTTLESRKTTLQFTQAKYDLKQATDTDLLTAQVNEGSAELDLADGQNTLNTARQRLANLLGLPTDTAFTALTEPDPAPPAATLDEAIALGKKQRTELQIADLNARSSAIDAALARGTATPTVAVSGGVSDVVDLTASRSVLVASVGVSVGAPLWDAGVSGTTADQAEKLRTGYVTQVHQLGQSIPVDIQEGWNAWVQAQKRYELAKVNQKNYDLQLVVAKAQLDAGSKTLADEFTAEINASTAEFALLKAKITAQLAALTLQSLLGL
jgi:outer membrane protein